PAQSTLSRAVKCYVAKIKRERTEAARQRAKIIAAVLREFDDQPFHGPDDWNYRRSFKDNLREVLLDYLSGPAGKVHVHSDRVYVPSGYMLSGQPLGGFFVLKPTED